MSNGTLDAPAGTQTAIPDFVRVVGHSNLFYWWPVWAVGFLLAALSYADDYRMAVVPAGTVAERARQVEGVEGPRDVLDAPAGVSLPAAGGDAADQPELRVSRGNNLGVIFAAVLLVVILVSTVTFRGLVSLLVIVGIVAVVLLFALLGWWDDILAYLGGLHVRMNGTGYMVIAVPLFLVWAFVTVVYDRQVYMIFDQGQIRVRREIGDSETVIDAHGVVVEKKRDDVFRHWLLGFGSGDLRVRAGGAGGHEYEIDNVLGIGRKLVLIQRMLQERQVSAAVASPMVGAPVG